MQARKRASRPGASWRDAGRPASKESRSRATPDLKATRVRLIVKGLSREA